MHAQRQIEARNAEIGMSSRCGILMVCSDWQTATGDGLVAKKKAFDYPGERATVSWDGQLCIHIGECGRAKGELFVGGRKPWCQPDLAEDDEVLDVVMRCPTGSLSMRTSDGENPESATDENFANVAYNGPLFIRGQSSSTQRLSTSASACRTSSRRFLPGRSWRAMS